MLSKREEDALRALEASLRSDETFSKSSTKLLTRIDKKQDKAIGLKRGLLCVAVGIALLFGSVFLNIFALAVVSGAFVTAGIYLAIPWHRVFAKFSSKVVEFEQSFMNSVSAKKNAKKRP